MGNKIPEATLKQFLTKYCGKSNNPNGINKFLHKLAAMVFHD
jgi:hypothetical protein